MINKKRILVIFVLVIILILVIFIKRFNSNEEFSQLTFNEVIAENSVDEVNNEVGVEEKIKVHITGSVNNPGLVELSVGSRIYDAIELAGGLTNEADVSKTNLAYILSDGEKIYIPNINDEETNSELTSLNSNNKVNINTADSSQLQTISGVGEATANSIIEYRTKNRKV